MQWSHRRWLRSHLSVLNSIRKPRNSSIRTVFADFLIRLFSLAYCRRVFPARMCVLWIIEYCAVGVLAIKGHAEWATTHNQTNVLTVKYLKAFWSKFSASCWQVGCNQERRILHAVPLLSIFSSLCSQRVLCRCHSLCIFFWKEI